MHGDPWLDNLIVRRDGSVHVVDWDELAPGDPVQDWAILLGPGRRDLGIAIERLHLLPRPLTGAEEARLGLWSRATALDWVIDPLADWVEADPDTDHGRAVRRANERLHEKAFARYTARYPVWSVGVGCAPGPDASAARIGYTRDMDRPPLDRMLEYGIYVDDVEETAAFYERVFGFPRLVSSGRLVALDVAGTGVLLVFERGASTEAVDTPNGLLPPHDGEGNAHFAFAVHAGTLDAWATWLGRRGVAIESTMEWDRGGRSLYFRDPEGHLVELVTPGTWSTW